MGTSKASGIKDNNKLMRFDTRAAMGKTARGRETFLMSSPLLTIDSAP